MTENPKLHIPQPTARPGDQPDFSYIDLSPAGAVDRPPVDAAVRDIEHLASEMVRVLDDDHEAQGPWDPNLDPEKLQVGLQHPHVPPFGNLQLPDQNEFTLAAVAVQVDDVDVFAGQVLAEPAHDPRLVGAKRRHHEPVGGFARVEPRRGKCFVN